MRGGRLREMVAKGSSTVFPGLRQKNLSWKRRKLLRVISAPEKATDIYFSGPVVLCFFFFFFDNKAMCILFELLKG